MNTKSRKEEKSTSNVKISLEKVYFVYKSRKIDVLAINGITSSFSRGKINIVMGPSGSGKSTLLNLIGGLLTPVSGKIYVDGVDITKFSQEELRLYRKEQVSYLFQTTNLISNISINKNLNILLNFYSNEKKKRKEKLSKIKNLVNIKDFLNHKPEELSGGQRQLASLAITLLSDAKLILADEPTGDLDTRSREIVIDVFKKISRENKDTTILIVTHDPAFMRIADNAFFIEDGKISAKLDRNDIGKYLDKYDYFGTTKKPFSNKKLEISAKLKGLEKDVFGVIEKIRKIYEES